MTNLNCCVESCAFNKSEHCCLNNIEVEDTKQKFQLRHVAKALKKNQDF